MRHRVQTRGCGERGWRTQAVIAEQEAAMREARRVVELRTWGRFRQFAFVRVVVGRPDEPEVLAAWVNGTAVMPSALRVQGVA